MSADRLIRLLSTAFSKDEDSNNYKIIAIIASGFDELENVLEDVRKVHFVETASGRSLDNIAKLFNVTRQQGETDEDLRVRLFVELRKYLSCGTKSDILQAVQFYAVLSDEDYDKNLYLIEPEPAHFIVVVPVLNTYDKDLRGKLYYSAFRAWFKEKLQYIVNQVKAGGVKGDIFIFLPNAACQISNDVTIQYGMATTWQGMTCGRLNQVSIENVAYAMVAKSVFGHSQNVDRCTGNSTTWTGESSKLTQSNVIISRGSSMLATSLSKPTNEVAFSNGKSTTWIGKSNSRCSTPAATSIATVS